MEIEFQIYDYSESHDIDSTNSVGEYIINVFGRTEAGKSVYAKITGYTPYFYIELPKEWTNKIDIKNKLKTLANWLKSKDNTKIWYKYKNTLQDIKLISAKKPNGFTYNTETNEYEKYYFAKLFFNNSDGMKKYASFFENNDVFITNISNNPIKFKLYESNLTPMLRCFHLRNISGCSWVSCNNYVKVSKENKQSYCKIELNIDWENLNPIKKDFNAPFKIASFDIECFSHDGQFPQANRAKDEIIQIGITYTLLGQSVPYKKWIACLDKTDEINSIEVISCDSESDLIDEFITEILKSDCDIITGYNIFYFDEKYIYDRCDKILNMKEAISRISKLKNKECNFREIKLASSALGENLLKFWETPGRVHIDLLKDVQKTYNLSNYKLDSVASHFIRGEIKKYNKINDEYELECASIKDIHINDYIHIEIIKGFISDEIGNKYLVTNIDKENKKIYIKSDKELDDNLNITDGTSLFWSQAKDDIGPKEIFSYQMMGSKERAIVAKYCIKDCSLVNLLINKLEVITKNIEMANVCYVPLNYLFIRGQGIKLFSLVLKEFRENGYVFPVIKVKKDINGDIEKEESYEGAIVFDPVPMIDYEANTTKDYASLYPSSILHKNMSHETEVLNPDYDNLPGITYFNASFKENDGTIKNIRFAKKEDELGIIPTILNNLLKERKNVKKLMKSEKDEFKYKILDAKQLALKLTANSLYGQLGAGTSPIANRNIAACTTSTGREMLLFAKKYDEELLPWIMNGFTNALENNDEYKFNKLIEWELKNKDEKFINKLKNYCLNVMMNYNIQPVVRYGDTDSVFTCFRFTEKKELLNYDDSLILFKKIMKFGLDLLEPLLSSMDYNLLKGYYEKYLLEIIDLELPNTIKCKPLSNNINILLFREDRMLQFLKEYIFENYLSWLWALQESVLRSFDNFEIKFINWSRYLLSKYNFTTIDLNYKYKEEIINPLVEKIESYYNKNNIIIWSSLNDEQILELTNLFLELFQGKLNKTKTEINKLIRIFINDTLREDWINAIEFHNVNETIEKKKLKRERLYNNKSLLDLLVIFIESKLKMDFNKYKDEHYKTIIEFINNELKDYIIHPYWDIVDDEKKYKIKIYNKSEAITDKRTLDFSLEMGVLSGELVKSRLPFPHDLEYEKSFWPFLILTKKRYVGNKYEFNNNSFYQDFMGIVLKRRDNAPIVKEICSGIINYLIDLRDPIGAREFVINFLEDMFKGNFDIKYFLQSRTLKLKESYKDWTKIAHVFLSEKIAEREGSKPESGNRIEYAVIVPEKTDRKLLQGEIIETPQYIKEHNIPINYIFYMKNQIMNPVLQFLTLVDKYAESIFKEMENKYGQPKAIKPIKERVIKEKVVKPRVIKEKKVTKSKSKETTKTKSKKVSSSDIIPKKKSKKSKKNVDDEIKKLSKKISKTISKNKKYLNEKKTK